MKVLLLLASVTVPSLITHLSLYGWHKAPANTVSLGARQWGSVALIVTPLGATSILLMFARSRQLMFPPDSDWPGVLLMCCLLGLVSVAHGMAPSLHEPEDEADTAPKGTDTNTL